MSNFDKYLEAAKEKYSDEEVKNEELKQKLVRSLIPHKIVVASEPTYSREIVGAMNSFAAKNGLKQFGIKDVKEVWDKHGKEFSTAKTFDNYATLLLKYYWGIKT